MSEHETRDFMSVNSFSQLPFIRPAPAREKPSSSTTTGIRLFGIEVPHEPGSTDEDSAKDTDSSSNNNSGSTNNGTVTASENGRKFECHYCCRHFPTSQALGGHQNAHKRERQHAKRAHLQSAMAAAHHNQSMDGHNVYGLLNYPYRLGSVPSSGRFTIDPPPAVHYPSWHVTGHSNNSLGASFYGGLGSVTQPINGSPLPGLWRVPSVMHGSADIGLVHRDRPTPLPLLQGGEQQVAGVGGAASCSTGFVSSSSPSSTSLQSQYVCQSMPCAKENVSLDLHL